MGSVRRRGWAAVACALVVATAVVIACSDKYDEDTLRAGDAGVEATKPDVDLPDVSASDAPVDAATSCPPVFMPAEGTYLYRPYLASDQLVVNDSGVDLEPFQSPFVVTVVHRPGACFEFTTFLSKGDKGEHEHTWRFCNACSNGATLDLESESDHFVAKGLADQTTTYTCGHPNPFVVSGLAPDATVAQAACTGLGSGSREYTVVTSSTSYRFVKAEAIGYTDQDASRPTLVFERKSRVLVAGGGAPDDDTSTYKFDADSGLPMVLVVNNETRSKIGNLDVRYTLHLIAARANDVVSPLPP